MLFRAKKETPDRELYIDRSWLGTSAQALSFFWAAHRKHKPYSSSLLDFEFCSRRRKKDILVIFVNLDREQNWDIKRIRFLLWPWFCELYTETTPLPEHFSILVKTDTATMGLSAILLEQKEKPNIYWRWLSFRAEERTKHVSLFNCYRPETWPRYNLTFEAAKQKGTHAIAFLTVFITSSVVPRKTEKKFTVGVGILSGRRKKHRLRLNSF